MRTRVYKCHGVKTRRLPDAKYDEIGATTSEICRVLVSREPVSGDFNQKNGVIT